ncbi:YciI family protein [Terriglobus sp. ADX1]|uniref:YciI family protein n=1 Tax=Terriglobus sp. ADX1 TaxID=2794063 RepID=UPI002FE5C0EF
MAFFDLKLTPPRPTFAMDMSDEERAVMMAHRVYMDRYFAEGKVLIFGPVLDPEGAFGMGVMECESVEEVQTIMADDPSVKGGLNRLEVHSMRIGGAQASRTQ